ncbi:MAG: ABC transporter substrate-binding protein [Bryobacteraceae bacterium]
MTCALAAKNGGRAILPGNPARSRLSAGSCRLKRRLRPRLAAPQLLILLLVPLRAPAQGNAEIKIGNVMPYTGAFSEYGATGRAEAAYFQMVNEQGGVNGRQIKFISLDSGSDTGKAVALAHQLVEQDGVLATVGIWGTPANLEIRPYMNEKKVPQLFVAATESAFDDPSHFPWTMAFQASKRTEGLVYAKYILQSRPGARIAILYAQDASGQEWLRGIRDGLGEKAQAMIVKEATFEYSDPAAVDAQIAAFKNSGADVFMNLAVGRMATHAIRKAYDIGWHPLQFIPNASLSVAAFLEPAGLAKAAGIVCNARSKSWLQPQSKEDPAVRAYLAWMEKYNPGASLRDANNVYGYEVAQTMLEVLKKCGNDLTRANVMKQAASLDLELGMLRPGIRIKTSPTDYQPIKQLFLIQFDGRDWGPVNGR